MSLSRQVLSSPFDVAQRPRTAACKQNGDRKRVKEGGSSLANSKIMVDTRVVRRNPFNPSRAKHDNVMQSDNTDQQPGCILFDSRLIKGDIFANPIVTVTGGHECNDGENRKEADSRGASACGRRAMSTPPPVKGRHHVSVQTDHFDMIDAGISQPLMSVTSCAQTDLLCSLQDQAIGVDGEEVCLE
mmetsp:Transcript_42309/g.76325  ORF Transcript_42309/g.76325 Transcript_42309/m.76325 type:complete len:187 (+) Transcript_42309:61-621(+)